MDKRVKELVSKAKDKGMIIDADELEFVEDSNTKSKQVYCHIWKNYYLQIDSYQFIILEQRIVEDKNSKNYGEPYYTTITGGGYITNFKTLADKLLRLELAKEQHEDIRSLLKRANTLLDEIAQAVGVFCK